LVLRVILQYRGTGRAIIDQREIYEGGVMHCALTFKSEGYGTCLFHVLLLQGQKSLGLIPGTLSLADQQKIQRAQPCVFQARRAGIVSGLRRCAHVDSDTIKEFNDAAVSCT
jgi:hypothetical protein